jgi:hypothetical protein
LSTAGFVDGGGSVTGGVSTSPRAGDTGRYQLKDGLMICAANDDSAPQKALIFKSGSDIMIVDLTLASGAGKQAQCVQAPLRSVAKFSP